MEIELPVRFTSRDESQPELITLKLILNRTAFLLDSLINTPVNKEKLEW